MSKGLIVGLVVAGVLVLGGAGWYVYSSNNNESGNSSTVSVNENTEFLAPFSQPVTMTSNISGSKNPSENGTVVIKFKDKNTWSIKPYLAKGRVEYINIGGYFYVFNYEVGSWYRKPSSAEMTTIFDSFAPTDEQMRGFKNNAIHKGKSACTLGTCEVYESAESNTGEKVTLKIGPGRRIAEMAGNIDGKWFKIVFDYNSPINIEAPSRYQETRVPN